MINLAKLCCEDGLICDVFIYAFAMQCLHVVRPGRELSACIIVVWNYVAVCITHTQDTPCNELIKVSDQSEGSLAMWAEFDTSINYSLVTARAFTVPSSMGGQETTPTCVHVTAMSSPSVCMRWIVCTCVRDRKSMHGPWIMERVKK